MALETTKVLNMHNFLNTCMNEANERSLASTQIVDVDRVVLDSIRNHDKKLWWYEVVGGFLAPPPKGKCLLGPNSCRKTK